MKATDIKKITANERIVLAELYRATCDGDEWNSHESDFQPVRVEGSIGFDNGMGYIWTVDGESFSYSENDIARKLTRI